MAESFKPIKNFNPIKNANAYPIIMHGRCILVSGAPKVREWSYWLSYQAIERWRTALVPEWTNDDIFSSLDPSHTVDEGAKAITSPLLETLDRGDSSTQAISVELSEWFENLTNSLESMDGSGVPSSEKVVEKLKRQPATLEAWLTSTAIDLVPRSDGFSSGATHRLQLNLHGCLLELEQSDNWHEYIYTLRNAGTQAAIDYLTERIESLQSDCETYITWRSELVERSVAGLYAYGTCCARLVRNRHLRAMSAEVATAVAVLERSMNFRLRAQACEVAKEAIVAMQGLLFKCREELQRIDRVLVELQQDYFEKRYLNCPKRSSTLQISLLERANFDEMRVQFEQAVGSSIHNWYDPAVTPPLDFMGQTLYELLEPIVFDFYAEEMGLTVRNCAHLFDKS